MTEETPVEGETTPEPEETPAVEGAPTPDATVEDDDGTPDGEPVIPPSGRRAGRDVEDM